MKTETTYDPRIAAIHSLRVNLKSLAAEALIIRQEQNRAGMRYREAPSLHRRCGVREEARYTLLALAFARGMPYRRVEQQTKSDISLKRLSEKIHRHWRRDGVWGEGGRRATWTDAQLASWHQANAVAELQGAAPGFQSEV